MGGKRARYILLALMAWASVLGSYVYGETVYQKEAMKLAQTFFNTMYGEVTPQPKMVWNGRQLTTDRLFAPFYIYNSPRGGFVMISAENKAFPILAYSRDKHFSREGLGEQENELLQTFAREIELIRYDSRFPTRAFDAWRDIPKYVTGVLNTPYITPEYRALNDEEKEKIETIDRRNGWIVMPTAVEFDIYNPQRYREITLDDITVEDEEIPFSFYEDFINAVRSEQQAREGELEELISPTRPVIDAQGGGRYVVTMPAGAVMMRTYALAGNKVLEKYFKDTQTVNVNLEALPNGYYVCLILDEDGKIYGFKLAR